MRNKTQNSKVKSQNYNSKFKTNMIERIFERTRDDVEERKHRIPLNVILSETKNLPRSFGQSLRMTNNRVAIIAEIKFRSPTNPRLGSSKDLIKRAVAYEKAGADAISIITEKHFFKGNIGFVSQVKKAVKISVLQKDFVIDEYQIYEAKMAGADALLLIARIVSKTKLQQFVLLAQQLGIEPIVEVHNKDDLKKAVATKTSFIAVNARDLETFTVDVEKACRLMKKIPDKFIKLGFSGVLSSKEVQQYADDGAKGVLVGTSVMKAKNIKDFIESLKI